MGFKFFKDRKSGLYGLKFDDKELIAPKFVDYNGKAERLSGSKSSNYWSPSAYFAATKMNSSGYADFDTTIVVSEKDDGFLELTSKRYFYNRFSTNSVSGYLYVHDRVNEVSIYECDRSTKIPNKLFTINAGFSTNNINARQFVSGADETYFCISEYDNNTYNTEVYDSKGTKVFETKNGGLHPVFFNDLFDSGTYHYKEYKKPDDSKIKYRLPGCEKYGQIVSMITSSDDVLDSAFDMTTGKEVFQQMKGFSIGGRNQLYSEDKYEFDESIDERNGEAYLKVKDVSTDLFGVFAVHEDKMIIPVSYHKIRFDDIGGGTFSCFDSAGVVQRLFDIKGNEIHDEKPIQVYADSEEIIVKVFSDRTVFMTKTGKELKTVDKPYLNVEHSTDDWFITKNSEISYDIYCVDSEASFHEVILNTNYFIYGSIFKRHGKNHPVILYIATDGKLKQTKIDKADGGDEIIVQDSIQNFSRMNISSHFYDKTWVGKNNESKLIYKKNPLFDIYLTTEDAIVLRDRITDPGDEMKRRYSFYEFIEHNLLTDEQIKQCKEKWEISFERGNPPKTNIGKVISKIGVPREVLRSYLKHPDIMNASMFDLWK